MAIMRYTVLVSMAALLGGCMPQWDLQGHDPKAFYSANPPKNKVETRTQMHMVHFAPGASTLPADELAALRMGVRDVSPMAVETLQVQLHPSQMRNSLRKNFITKQLRNLGYVEADVLFESSDTLDRDEARIDIGYAVTVLPHCPDWRRSPVTTYSNTSQGNFGCASTVNLGLMVADPRDLERGEGNGTPDTERTTQVIRDYRGGKDFGAADTGDSGGGAEAEASTGATPAAQ